MGKFIKDFMKRINDKTVSIAADAEACAEYNSYIDTGSYALNALLSGSIYGGIPDNKIIMFAGESATGKTFFVLGICNAFLRDHPDGIIIYYDSEAAVTKDMMEDRGIDTTRVLISEPVSVQDFHQKVIDVLDNYNPKEKAIDPSAPKDKNKVVELENKPPLMIVLDSLGNLPSIKELLDSTKGHFVQQVGGKSQSSRALFRTITQKAAKAGIPILITNHVYTTLDQWNNKVISGGMGPIYAASIVATLTKKKEKEGDEIIGNIVHVKMHKSRLSKENAQVDVKITYKHGLDRYYGLLDLAEKYDIIKKESTQYVLSDGRKVYGKHILENPEAVFTKDILDQLDKAANREFCYGDDSEIEKIG